MSIHIKKTILIGEIDFGNNLNLLRCGCFLAGAAFFCEKSPGTPKHRFKFYLIDLTRKQAIQTRIEKLVRANRQNKVRAK